MSAPNNHHILHTESTTTIRNLPSATSVQHSPAPTIIQAPNQVSTQELLDRLRDFNNHVEHIADIKRILMNPLGLSNDDADVFIRSGVDSVFGRSPALTPTGPTCNPGLPATAGPDNKLKTPEAATGIWMNELREDFDERKFFIERTKPVLLTFDQSSVTMRRPNHRVVPRMAMYNEVENKGKKNITWTEERHDLRNADVFLLPLSVPVKIRWLSRFPIVIKMREADQPNREIVVESNTSDATFFKKDDRTLFLFARCDREKEELFWRFITASGKSPFRFAMPTFELTPDMTPLTAFIQRLGADILVDPLWRKILIEKIGQKLGQIKRPHYLDDLKVVDVNLGRTLPKFGEVSRDIRSDRLGMWFEVDFEWRGPILFTLTANLNLIKMTHPEESKDKGKENDGDRTKLAYNTLSTLYGGYESEEFEEDTEMPEKAKPKAMRIMEYIAESTAFKYISEIGIIKRKLEEISDTDMVINAELKLIKGRMALNIPLPPSDRLWYGFIPTPQVELTVTPMMGEKKVDFTMVTDFLEKSMVKQCHQIFTIPNMDDITVPFANSGIDPEEYRYGKLQDFVIKLG